MKLKIYTFFILLLLTLSGLFATEKTAIITADQMELDKKGGFTQLEGNVQVQIRSKEVSLKAGKLKITRDNISHEIIKAEVDIDVVLRQKDQVFSGDHMFYDRSQAIAELRGNLELKVKNATIKAEHILYRLDTEQGKITAKKGEVVQINIHRKSTEDEKMARIDGQAKEIHLYKKTGILNLSRQVQIKDLLKEVTFRTDNATLFFNQSDEVEEIIAEGNFYLNQPGRYSVADRAHFNYVTGKIILSGDVLVRDKDRVELKSSKVEMFLDVSKGFISGGDNKPLQLKIPLPN